MAYDPKLFTVAVQKLRPGIKPNDDYQAVMTKDGPRIVEWYRQDLVQPTQTEIEAVDTAVAQAESDDKSLDDSLKTERILRAFIMAINDGSMPVGQNKSMAFIKNVIKTKLSGA